MAKVLHASYSGYFPACLIEESTLATQPLEDAMAIYWKVKSWTVTISGALPVSPRTFTRTDPDETYLVCNNNEFSPSDENNVFFLYGFFVNSYSNPTLYGVIPQFFISGDGQMYTSGGGDEFATLVGSYTVFGQSYPLFRITDEGDETPASGVIVPASYWPYQS